jgi:acyl-coenzyme A synthetase/AMP-(fatty) acid ligase
MKETMTFVDKIRWQCRMLPREPALVLPHPSQDVVTYGRLDSYLNNACRSLRAMGIVPGTVYGIMVRDPLLHLVLSLAVEELGAGTMALRDLNIPASWPFTAILSDRDVGETSRCIVRVTMNWLEGDGRPSDIVEKRGRSRDDICRIALTSGSTGTPKGVVFTHDAWDRRIAYYDYICGPFGLLSRTMSCIVGTEYRYCVYALSRGAMYCFPDASIESTARKIAQYGVQYLAASATTLGNIVTSPHADRKLFSSIELVRTGGSHLPRKLFERVRETICPRVMSSYGSSETGTIATGWAESLDLEAGEVGFIAPGTEIEIVDPDTRLPVSSGPGVLRVYTRTLASGYFVSDPTNAFDGGAFHTNDIGSVVGGRVTLEGRSKNVVNLGGDKATIERIELHYAKAPGIYELAVVPVRDSLGVTKIVAVVVPNDQWSEAKAWDHFRGNLPRTYWPLKLVVAQQLPRGGNGKVDRAKLETLVSG